jgi:hypothetical protein
MALFCFYKVSLHLKIFTMPDTTIRSNAEVVLIGQEL